MKQSRMLGRLIPTAVVLSLLLPPLASASDPHAHHKAQVTNTAATVSTHSAGEYLIPDLQMLDQSGATVDLQELLETDKPVLVNFIFTTCTAICPMMSSIFMQVQRNLGEEADDVVMISVSIDPEEDTPDVLAEYAGRFGAGPQWHFLTGSLEDSIAVQKAFDAYRGDKMNHAPLTLIRDGVGGNWVRFDSFSNAEELAAQARSMM